MYIRDTEAKIPEGKIECWVCSGTAVIRDFFGRLERCPHCSSQGLLDIPQPQKEN